MQLDEWQKQVLSTEGNICVCSGRQVGKSTVVSIKSGEFVANNINKTVLIIAATERQARLLFEKTLDYLHENYRDKIRKGKDRPTKHTIKLKNGSTIHCLPTGISGYGIRGYTIDMLIADEAHFIPEEVWAAVTPMLSVTKGNIILLSTPHGREGYFFRAFSDPNFTPFHVSSEECERIDEQFLMREKERMTKLQYAQEYLGQFVDELRQFFPDSLIRSAQILIRAKGIDSKHQHFLGVDVARMGNDESTFQIVKRISKDALIHVESIVTTKTLTTDTTRRIVELEGQYNFRKIYIDDGGMGVGVFDQLLGTNSTKRKIVAINNASRALDRDEKRKKKLLKEDLYNNLLRLMEQGKIKLLDDDEIFQSLKSIQYEYTERGELKIFGNYSHITEGLIRAAWCVRDKGLNIWIQTV